MQQGNGRLHGRVCWVDREVGTIVLAAWGRVVGSDGVVPWLVEDHDGQALEPVYRFLKDLVARGKSSGTIRTYAYELLRWWRFLLAVGVTWERATAAEVRDLVLWFQAADKPVAGRRTVSKTTAGTVNAVTRKPYQDDRYKASTVRNSNAVIRSFYDYWADHGQGPVVTPVPVDRLGGRRPNAHHNPLRPFRPEGRLRYNPPPTRRAPRAIPDELWDGLFGSMTCHRDRAILALDIGTGARAAELLGLRGEDFDWGEQLVQVRRKGSGIAQWLPASADAFVWMWLYFAEAGVPAPGVAVLRRANAKLGTNWMMHDLRHTCAIRMARDKHLSLRDVQVILGHAHLTTTQIYLEDDLEAVIGRVREHHARPATAPSPVAGGYRPEDLAVLFGGPQ